MGLINGALHIGRNAITASQAALAVTGNNMANAATPSYSRQSPTLAPIQSTEVTLGHYTGAGVALVDVVRQVNEALNSRLRIAVSDSASSLVQQQAMTRVETLFNELSDQDISTRLNAFFSAWQDLQNQPQDSASRNVVLQEAASLTNFIRELRDDLLQIQNDLDAEVRYQVGEANTLLAQVGELNEQITVAEAGGAGAASALRDQRDEALKQLSELISITTREEVGGSVIVFIGNDPAITRSGVRDLSLIEELDDNGNLLSYVAFEDNRQALEMSSGKLHGLLTTRDDSIGEVMADLDSWCKGLVYEVNNLHSLGQGLNGFSSITSTYSVIDSTAALSSSSDTALPWAVENGIFLIRVTDENTGVTTTHTVKIDAGIDPSTDTTLNDLATAISAIDNITASVDAAGYMTISADSSQYTFSFASPDEANDATNVLAVLGINTFFQGNDSATISVRQGLGVMDIAAGYNGLAGDGSLAGQIAALQTIGVGSFSGVSITEQFNSLVGEIASKSKRAQDNYASADVVVQTLESERQSISGVSMDEEAINMITYQRAFQGASKYVSIIDQMLDELLSMI